MPERRDRAGRREPIPSAARESGLAPCRRTPCSRQRGFTLLEILAALAIAAVGIAAVVQSIGASVSVAGDTEERLLATWVASNRVAELRLGRVWPAASTADRVFELGGRSWYVREQVSTTADPDIRRVDLSVHAARDEEHAAASLFGYLARYVPAAAPPDQGPDGQIESPSPQTDDTDQRN